MNNNAELSKKFGDSTRTSILAAISAILWIFIFVNKLHPFVDSNDENYGALFLYVPVVVTAAAAWSKLSDIQIYLRDSTRAIEASGASMAQISNVIEKSNPHNNVYTDLIRPDEIDQFERVFSSAKHIYAYNPPLQLLITDEPHHRNIIYNFLNNDRSVYKIIAGKTLIKRIKILKKKWTGEHGSRSNKAGFNKTISRMQISYYGNDSDLHSIVSPWIKRNPDIRGFSFFLVEGTYKKSVLLYIFGPPFVKDYGIPGTAIWAHAEKSLDGDFPEFKLFDDLMADFDERWRYLQNHVSDGKHAAETSTLKDIEKMVLGIEK